jgi:hypothetical protein
MRRNKREKRQERVVSAKKRVANREGSKLALRVPSDLPMVNVGKKACTKLFDFIPWKAGKGNTAADQGEYTFVREYYVHAQVGPNQDTFGCNAKNFNKPCYVCEWRNKNLGNKPDPTDEEKKMFGRLLPKQREAFLVRDRTEKKKGRQLWECSFHLFGKYLYNKIDTARGADKKARENFADPKVGSTLEITGVEKKTGDGGGAFLEFSDIQFKPRKEPLPPELVKGAPCVDEFVVLEDYKKVKESFLATQKSEDDEEEKEDEEEIDNEEGEDDEDDNGDSEDEDDTDDDDADSEDEDDEEESEEDEESGEDEGDADEDDEDADTLEPPCGKGDVVLFVYKKVKHKGTVLKVNEDDMLVRVRSKDRENPYTLDYDQIKKVVVKAKKAKKSRSDDF